METVWSARVAGRLRAAAGSDTAAVIAARTGSNHETVRRYLSGAAPKARFIAVFCAAYQVSADWLLCV